MQGPERCIVVRTQEGEERARATVRRQAQRDQQTWEKRLWHLGNQTFACQPDADAALATAWQRLPPSFVVMSVVTSQVGYAARGRPRTGATPTTQGWRIQATLTRDPVALEREALRRAAFLVGTNLLDTAAWPDEAIIAVYREQSVVERGFAFLKDQLFQASSVFVKRPERIMALAFVMTFLGFSPPHATPFHRPWEGALCGRRSWPGSVLARSSDQASLAVGGGTAFRRHREPVGCA